MLVNHFCREADVVRVLTTGNKEWLFRFKNRFGLLVVEDANSDPRTYFATVVGWVFEQSATTDYYVSAMIPLPGNPQMDDLTVAEVNDLLLKLSSIANPYSPMRANTSTNASAKHAPEPFYLSTGRLLHNAAAELVDNTPPKPLDFVEGVAVPLSLRPLHVQHPEPRRMYLTDDLDATVE